MMLVSVVSRKTMKKTGTANTLTILAVVRRGEVSGFSYYLWVRSCEKLQGESKMSLQLSRGLLKLLSLVRKVGEADERKKSLI